MSPLAEGSFLRIRVLALTGALLAATACSVARLELQNYAFYGAAPEPDGARLRPLNATERFTRTADGDTLAVAEGEFRIDSTRQADRRIWLVTRTSQDVEGRPLVDSIWMDRYTLRTIRSVQHSAEGRTELEYNRRSVRSERITPDGRRQTWRGLHDAAPYGLLGIEIVIGALPMRLGSVGGLPVVDGRGDRLRWLEFEIVEQTTEMRRMTGGTLPRPVWLIQGRLDGQTLHFWVDQEERVVTRRSVPGPDNTRLLVMRGPPVPRVQVAPVERIGDPLPSETRVLRQGTSSVPVASGP